MQEPKVNVARLRLLKLERTHEKGRPQKGQWYLDREGEPRQSDVDRPLGDFSGADVFEFLRPLGEQGMEIYVRCPSCGKEEGLVVEGWSGKREILSVRCKKCESPAP